MGGPCASAACVGRVHLVGSWPPRFSRQISSSDMLATISCSLRVLAEEMLARVGAALGLEVLVLAVDALFHALRSRPSCRVPAADPSATPEHLDDIPAGAAESSLQFLDDLAVAAHRAVEPLQVAVDDEDQVVELLPHRHGDRAHRLGLVHLAVAQESPHLAVGCRHDAAMFEVAHEARLIDRHHRPEAHRHRRELPEIRHQPGVRIRRQALAADLPGGNSSAALRSGALRDRRARRCPATNVPG